MVGREGDKEGWRGDVTSRMACESGRLRDATEVGLGRRGGEGGCEAIICG